MVRTKLLVTGASGFIGRNLLPMLKNSPYEIYALTIDESNDDDDIRWIKCDILNESEVEKTIADIKPDFLVHLAWKVQASNYDLPDNFEWFNASIKLINSFRNHGGRRIMIAGSGIEYDWQHGLCCEDHTPQSYQTVYGACKNILREYLIQYSRVYGISYVWPRIFFVYGPHETPNRLVPYIINSLLDNQEANITSGDIYQDYTYIKDLANMLALLLKSEFTGVINVGSGAPVKIGDIAFKIGDKLGKSHLVSSNQLNPIKYPIVVSNNNRIREVLDWSPKYTLDQGLTETIDFWKSNKNE